MHQQARNFIQTFETPEVLRVIEIGSRNINGSARDYFPSAIWTGLDLYPGPDVDVVCNAVEYDPPDGPVDLVVCCEVLEHTPQWRELIAVSYGWLKDGGCLIVTCAGPGRDPHSSHDGGALRPGEYYGNLDEEGLVAVCESSGFRRVDIFSNAAAHDTYCRARK